MSTDWISDLRVVDLKEELKKRELPVSGKKADLVARLTEAVEAEAGGVQEEPPAPAADGDPVEAASAEQQPAALPEHVSPASGIADGSAKENNAEHAVREPSEKAKPKQAATEPPGDPAPQSRPDVEGTGDEEQPARQAEKAEAAAPGGAKATPATEAVTGTSAPASPAEPAVDEAEAPDAAPAGPADPAPIAAPAERHDPDPVPPIAEPAAAGPPALEAAAEEPVSATPRREERLPSMQAALLAPQTALGAAAAADAADAEMEEAVDFEAEDVEEAPVPGSADQKPRVTSAKKPREEAPAADDQTSKRAKQDEPDMQRADSGKRKREPILFKPREKQPAAEKAEELAKQESADVKPLEKRSSVFDRIGSLNSEEKRIGGTGAPPTRIKPTRALLVTGFIRPFTVTAAQNLFKSYGAVEKMWMPMIRDKAYVLFGTEEAAEAARQGTHGLEWPHGNRTSLRPKFVPVEEAEKVIDSGGKDAPSPATKPSPAPAKQPDTAAPGASKTQGASLERRQSDKGVTGSGAVEKKRSADQADGRSTQIKQEKPKEEKKAASLEDLFRKTEAVPHLYWKSLTQEQIIAKQKAREMKVRDVREDRHRP